VYFKRRFPASRVIAFEADPRVFSVLQRNVAAARYDDVELVNKAVWDADGEVDFWEQGADAGRIMQQSDANVSAHVRLSTIRLRQYLTAPVEFLKLDIEGAETNVLRDCADLLGNVRQLFVEYHSFAGEEQQLDLVIGLLKSAGFRVYVQTAICSAQPFLQVSEYLGMDLQLNVFAIRPNSSASKHTVDG
jgi:FkbM family methyltransferase